MTVFAKKRSLQNVFQRPGKLRGSLQVLRAEAESPGDGEQEILLRNLQETVTRLREDNKHLQAELAEARRWTADDKEAQADVNDSAGPFFFPKADVPMPLQSVRLKAPGQVRAREAFGDWLSLFRNAAPYMAAFRGGTVVVHVPSRMLDEDMQEAFKGVMEDVAFCSLLGLKVVLVMSIETRVLRRLEAKAGQKITAGGVIVGNRLTGITIDEKALNIAKQEAGSARVEVESALGAGFEKRSSSSGGNSTSAGLFPVRGAVSVISSTNFFTASPMGVREGKDQQYAGLVRSVNADLMERQLQEGDIVLLTPIGASPGGDVFFVSSEQLAASVAKKLQAIKLVYLSRGQVLVDTRENKIVAGMQAHDARHLLEHLKMGSHDYPEEERQSEWFCDFVRVLELLVLSVCPKGVLRGHLVDPFPGSLLQEFFTTDGSGTCVAQDLYQGLGRANVADASLIQELFAEEQLEQLDINAIQACCAAGEFFVWRRDELILGCGQLVAHKAASGTGQLIAELRYLRAVEGAFSVHAPALFAYAERAAVLGGAMLLVVRMPDDAEHAAWFRNRGLREALASEETILPAVLRETGRKVLALPLGKNAEGDAEDAFAAFTEEQRMWGGTAAR